MSCYRVILRAALVGVFATYAIAAGAATDYVAEAERLAAKGDLRAAEIELKNAVRDNPQNMAAHYRLARIELELGNAPAAEFEARSAQVGGYNPDEVVPLLAKAYLAQRKYQELLRDFSGTEGSATERAGVLVQRGYAQIALGKPDDGLASFDEAQALAPNLPEALVAKARLLIDKKDLAGAQALLTQALTLAPQDKEARLINARVLRINGKLPQALAILGEILTDAPSFVPARLDRADLLIAQNQDTAAKEDISAVLLIEPRNALAIYLNAILAIKQKDFDTANTELQKLSGVIASFPRGYYVLALVQYNLKQLDQALDSAQRFVARNPDALAGQKLLAAIELAQGHPTETVSALEKFQSAGTADAGALNILGRAYMQLGKTGEAVSAFDAAAKLAPQDPQTQLLLGVGRLKLGDTEKGMGDIEQSLELAPSAPAAEMLVALDLAAGHWEEARAAVDKLKQAQPNSPLADNLDGILKAADFNLDAAHTTFSQVLEAHPDNLSAQFGLARVMELQGQLDQAEEILNKALTANPTSAVVLSRLLPLLLREGKADAAVAAAMHAHAAAPTDHLLTVALIDLYIHLGRKDDALTLAREEGGGNTLADFPLIAARARAEVAGGLNSDAAQTFRRLIAIAPARVDTHRALASVLLSAGDVAGARQTITEAMTVSPNNPQLAADLIAIDLKTGGVEAALTTAHQLQKDDPMLPTAPALEGDVYMEAKQYKDAADAYTKALEQSPSRILTVQLAQAKVATGDRDAAIGILKNWLKDHAEDLEVTQVLAGYEITGGYFDDAKAHLEQVVAAARPNAIALNNLAWLYQRAGDPRAMAIAKRAYFLTPGVPQVADTLGWILVQQNQVSSGIGVLEEAGAARKDDFEIQYHLAVALNDTGQKDKALAILKALTADTVTFDDKPSAQKLFAELSKQQ